MSSPARKRFTRRRARSSCREPCSKAASKMKTLLFVFDRETSFICRALCLFASLFLSVSRARATGSDSRNSARSLQEGEVEDGRKSRIPCSRREDSRNTRSFAKTSRDAIPWFRGRRGSSRTSRKWDRCLVNYCFFVEFSRLGMHSLFY